jgi:26S proteasome regulatory subunit N1
VSLTQVFTTTARDMGVIEPKTAEAIYKITANSNRRGPANAPPVDSARANLATSFVNGFANAGCCKDTLLTEDGITWIRR